MLNVFYKYRINDKPPAFLHLYLKGRTRSEMVDDIFQTKIGYQKCTSRIDIETNSVISVTEASALPFA